MSRSSRQRTPTPPQRVFRKSPEPQPSVITQLGRQREKTPPKGNNSVRSRANLPERKREPSNPWHVPHTDLWAQIFKALEREVHRWNCSGRISPFSELLENGPIDPNVRVTSLETFDGTTDPRDHTSYYESLMYVQNYTETTKCRLFVSTLKLHTRSWFTSLPAWSISSWEKLCDAFVDRFTRNCPNEMHTISLMHIKQGDDESLWEYIERFKKGVAPIKDLRMQEAITYFIRNLNFHANRDFTKDILSKSPQTLGEVHKIAQGHILVDEALWTLYPRADKKQSSGRGNDQPSERDGRASDRKRDRGSGNDKEPTRRGEEKEYTSLNKPIFIILKQIKDKPFFRQPKKLKAHLRNATEAGNAITIMIIVMIRANVSRWRISWRNKSRKATLVSMWRRKLPSW